MNIQASPYLLTEDSRSHVLTSQKPKATPKQDELDAFNNSLQNNDGKFKLLQTYHNKSSNYDGSLSSDAGAFFSSGLTLQQNSYDMVMEQVIMKEIPAVQDTEIVQDWQYIYGACVRVHYTVSNVDVKSNVKVSYAFASLAAAVHLGLASVSVRFESIGVPISKKGHFATSHTLTLENYKFLEQTWNECVQEFLGMVHSPSGEKQQQHLTAIQLGIQPIAPPVPKYLDAVAIVYALYSIKEKNRSLKEALDHHVRDDSHEVPVKNLPHFAAIVKGVYKDLGAVNNPEDEEEQKKGKHRDEYRGAALKAGVYLKGIFKHDGIGSIRNLVGLDHS